MSEANEETPQERARLAALAEVGAKAVVEQCTGRYDRGYSAIVAAGSPLTAAVERIVPDGFAGSQIDIKAVARNVLATNVHDELWASAPAHPGLALAANHAIRKVSDSEHRRLGDSAVVLVAAHVEGELAWIGRIAGNRYKAIELLKLLKKWAKS